MYSDKLYQKKIFDNKENFPVILRIAQLGLSEDRLYLIPRFQWKNKKQFFSRQRKLKHFAF